MVVVSLRTKVRAHGGRGGIYSPASPTLQLTNHGVGGNLGCHASVLLDFR
jgi:hypothetical protein